MRIVILCYRQPPNIGAASTRASNLANTLKARGHEVTMPRLWSPNLKYEGYLRRLLIYLGFLLSYSWWLVWEAPDCDEVRYVSPWALTSFSWPAILVGKLRGAKVVLDIHDAYIEVFPKALRWLVRFMAPVSAHFADEITLASLSMGEGLPKGKLVFEPLTADPIFKPLGKKPEGKFVVAYSGNLSKRYDFAMITEAAMLLPDIQFKIRGQGEEEGWLSTVGLPNLTLETEKLTNEELVEWLDSADALVCPIVDSEEARKSSIPQKLVEYMAMGKPVICTDVGEAGKAVKAYPKGYAVPAGDAEAFVQAITGLNTLGEGEGMFGSPLAEMPEVRKAD